MKLFYNANIISMDNNKIYKAMLVNDGKIEDLFFDNINPNDFLECEKINLNGKTILPSFIDAHSHITSVATELLEVDLSSCVSVCDVQEKIKKFIRDNGLTESDNVLLAKGYDHNRLVEKRHPYDSELDDVSNDIPIIIKHQSNHFGVFNTKAQNLFNVETKIGYIEETAYVNALKKIPMNIQSILNGYKKAQELYASYGITRVQDGMIVKEMVPLYKFLLSSNILYLDVNGLASIEDKDVILRELSNINSNFSISGYKIILDGSPQGKTAWMKLPYKNSGDFCGNGLIDSDKLKEYYEIAINDNMQLYAHCNGDMAIQQYIDVAKSFSENEIRKINPVIIHAQLLNPEQLDDVKNLGMIPSYFIGHVYYYGEVHKENFGDERASKISPLKSTLNKDVLFTVHQDSPVIKPNMFESIWNCVSRKTMLNNVLGEDEKIELYNAIEAVTINSARQYKIENDEGNLEKGKKANFIVISENPFAMEVDKIKNIKVEKTYRQGACIYCMKKVLFATKNVSKVNRFKNKLLEKGIEIISINDIDYDIEINENGHNAIENAMIKAKAYADHFNIPVFAMDDNLYIDNVPEDKQPGMFVRRVNGKVLNDDEMIEHYTNLAHIYGNDGRLTCRWVYGMAVINGSTEKTYTWSKDDFYIVDKPVERRNEGYPLNSISINKKINKYFVDITPEEKEKLNENEDHVIEFLLENLV